MCSFFLITHKLQAEGLSVKAVLEHTVVPRPYELQLKNIVLLLFQKKHTKTATLKNVAFSCRKKSRMWFFRSKRQTQSQK